MLSRLGISLILMILVLMPSSCAKLDQPSPKGESVIVKEALPATDSIPKKYGNLVSVSSVAEYPAWVQLWFQDENGNLRIVPYSIRDNRFAGSVRLIPQK